MRAETEKDCLYPGSALSQSYFAEDEWGYLLTKAAVGNEEVFADKGLRWWNDFGQDELREALTSSNVLGKSVKRIESQD